MPKHRQRKPLDLQFTLPLFDEEDIWYELAKVKSITFSSPARQAPPSKIRVAVFCELSPWCDPLLASIQTFDPYNKHSKSVVRGFPIWKLRFSDGWSVKAQGRLLDLKSGIDSENQDLSSLLLEFNRHSKEFSEKLVKLG